MLGKIALLYLFFRKKLTWKISTLFQQEEAIFFSFGWTCSLLKLKLKFHASEGLRRLLGIKSVPPEMSNEAKRFFGTSMRTKRHCATELYF